MQKQNLPRHSVCRQYNVAFANRSRLFGPLQGVAQLRIAAELNSKLPARKNANLSV